MLRLLLLITDLEIGGTPTVVRELARRLPGAADVDVEVACLAPWGPVADQLAAAGVRVTALGARGPVDVRVLPKMVRLLRARAPTIVLSFLVHANAVAAAASVFFPRIRFIQSIQTTQPDPRWHWWVQRLVARRAERIVVPSASVADVARSRSAVPEQKIVVIPNALDPAEFPPAPYSPAAWASREGPLEIGFIGRLDPIKRLPDLIEAVQLLDGQARLHIFGDGAQRSALERLTADRKIESHVLFHGAVPRPQEALAQIGMLVLPSEAEGFGLVLIEAMVSGVPVVATDVAGIRDVVRHRQTGELVPVASPMELARAIHSLRDEPGRWETIVAAARADVLARFTWPAVLRRYCDLLGASPADQ